MTNKLIQYLLDNEKYFVPVLDSFNNDYTTLPKNITVYPFYDKKQNNNIIDSALVTIKNDLVYLNIKEKNIPQCADFINSKIQNIFSLHGKTPILQKLSKQLIKNTRENIEYNVMILKKEDYTFHKRNIKGFTIKKTDETYFNILKNLQKKYHKEEVYNMSNYYPYKSEMINYKKTLSKRINFTVFTKDQNNKIIPLSKANVNGESQNFIQIGGVFTLKKYRNRGLSTLCLSELFDFIFKTTTKDIILFVKKKNEKAINLYKKFNFKFSHNLSIYYF